MQRITVCCSVHVGVCVQHTACSVALGIQHVAVYCSASQCVAVCRSVLRYVAVCRSVLQSVAICCNLRQCIPVCCSVWQCIADCGSVWQYAVMYCSVLQCEWHAAAGMLFVAVCYSLLQSVAVCWSKLQAVAVCCSVSDLKPQVKMELRSEWNYHLQPWDVARYPWVRARASPPWRQVQLDKTVDIMHIQYIAHMYICISIHACTYIHTYMWIYQFVRKHRRRNSRRTWIWIWT